MKEKLVFFWKKIDQRLNIGLLVAFFSRSQITLVAPTFAYYSLLTLFPILIATAVVLAIINADSTALMHGLSHYLPTSVERVVMPVMDSILKTNHKSYLSISIVFIIWTVSQVVAILRRTFNAIADVEDTGSNFLTRAWSFIWLIVALMSFVILSVAANVLSIVVHSLPTTEWSGFLTHQTHWIIIVGLWLILIMLNFFLPTRGARAPIRFVALGSAVELFFLMMLNKVFALYANWQLGRYDFYESVSSIVVFLIWLNLIATILVLGYVLIMWLASFQVRKETI